MQNCIQKFTRAPIQYINDLRTLKSGALTMSGTTFFPAFPVALASSFLCIIGLSIYMIFYFFTVQQNNCYSHITYGIIALAIIYPIESLVIYICLLGSVSLTQSHCWKVFTMSFFGLLVTGFSFGGLGFAFLCTINDINPLLIPATFLSSNAFIQAIVYSYISFVVLYLILVPLLTISYNQRNKDPKPEATCGDKFCCVIYYTFQILFMITALFMILIKILGPPLLIYVLIQVARANFYSSVSNLSVFFALSVLSICLPMFLFVTIYVIKNFLCNKIQTQQVSQQSKNTTIETATPQNGIQLRSSVKQRKSVFLSSNQPKQFGQDDSTFSAIKNNML